ncbi:MAG: stage III sporulation protein AE [Eubacteriaceae bacterium]|nr:stage III sporulation protein AE [Eubacteriaceae bacterium]
MKKMLLITLVFSLIFVPGIISAAEESSLHEKIIGDIDLSGLEEYTTRREFYELYGYTDPITFLYDIITGNSNVADMSFWDAVSGIVTGEMRSLMSLVVNLFAVGMLGIFVKSMSTEFLSSPVKTSVDIVMAVTVAMMMSTVFFDSSADCISATSDIVAVLGVVCPAMILLMASGGLVTTAGAVSPVLMLALGYGEFIINNILIPLSVCMFVMNIMDAISDGINLKNIVGLMKKSSTVMLGISFTVISGIINIEGITFSGADNIGLKAVKYAAGSLIPVVGGFLSGSVDTVLSLLGVVKNGVGILGVLTVISVMLIPLMRLLLIYAAMKLISAVMSIFSSDTTSDLIDRGASSLGFLITVNVSVMIMSMILIVILMNMALRAV